MGVLTESEVLVVDCVDGSTRSLATPELPSRYGDQVMVIDDSSHIIYSSRRGITVFHGNRAVFAKAESVCAAVWLVDAGVVAYAVGDVVGAGPSYIEQVRLAGGGGGTVLSAEGRIAVSSLAPTLVDAATPDRYIVAGIANSEGKLCQCSVLNGAGLQLCPPVRVADVEWVGWLSEDCVAIASGHSLLVQDIVSGSAPQIGLQFDRTITAVCMDLRRTAIVVLEGDILHWYAIVRRRSGQPLVR